MLPTVFTIPLPGGGGIPIKGYGLMMMIGFLSGMWLCMRRAEKVRSDPDIILNAGFLALLFGVFGARVFYVIHYWDPYFKGRGLGAVIDVTSGGLEWYGGFLAAVTAIVIYLGVKGYSIRLFLDIMSPSVMWGLAFGRLGCTLNGCCFGGTCAATVPWPLAVTFPYASPAHVHHFQKNRASLPRELLYIDSFGVARPIDRDHVAMKPEQIYGPKEKYMQATEALQSMFDTITPPEKARQIRDAWGRFAVERRLVPQGPSASLNTKAAQQATARLLAVRGEMESACAGVPQSQTLLAHIKQEHKAWATWQQHATELRDLLGDSRNPRPEPGKIQELQELAGQFRSHKVYAAQPMGFINAMIISGVLSLFFYRRRVHGAVFGLMFLIYPVTRTILEYIRADNPIDSGGLTISQAISVGIVPLAAVYMFIIYKVLPPQSPRAVIWEPPPTDPPPTGSGSDDRGEGDAPSSGPPEGKTDKRKNSSKKRSGKAKQRKSVVETVVVAPTEGEQEWHQAEASCAICGATVHPPDGLIYERRASKRSTPSRAPGVPVIESADANAALDLICETCFNQRPPQDKGRAKRLARKWWKTGKV